MTSAETRPVCVITARPSLGLLVSDIWKYRAVLAALAQRDIRAKYKQAALGLLWAILQPLAQVLIFTLVFRGVAKVETSVPYPVFALAGLVSYNIFQQILTAGTTAFVQSQGIVTKVYFPRVYTVLAATASPLLNACVSGVVLLAAMAIYSVAFSPRLLLAVPLLLAMVLLSVGTACFLGVLNARFRDVQHAMPLLLNALMFVSPVLYPLSAVPESIRPFAAWNPVSGIAEGVRYAVAGESPFSWAVVVYSVVVAGLVFAIGTYTFERSQAKLIDVL